ncbi:hypothetical protein QN400_23685, partial [Pseudomonas sp. RTC3]|nr:hypothetical protein [Pseudomonas sp. RTC3]MEB0243529.1 hypothetical protein [Pseudomonas sp. 5C2]
MSQLSYLYRRPGGIYAVRICVPVRFQLRLGKREIHVSTKVREVAVAKGTAYPIISYWKRLFLEWDGIAIPTGLSPSTAAPPIHELQFQRLPNHEASAVNGQSSLTCSELLVLFIDAKKGQWAEDQQRKMKTMCGMFTELMGDQLVESVSRQMLRAYQQKLSQLPRNIYLTRRKFSVTSVTELKQLTVKHKLDTMTLVTCNNYMQKLGEMFGWAVREDYLTKNPTLNLTQTKPKQRDQDARDIFDSTDLSRIFSASWFDNGGNYPVSSQNKHFRPYHYWLPLLGLCSGLMKPDTHLGENARQIEVSDDQT